MFFTNKIWPYTFASFLQDDFIFNSSVKDMQPYTMYKKDGEYILEVKTLGIRPEDISVTLDDKILTIKGETQNEYNDDSFNTQIKLSIADDLINKLDSIDYKSRDGLTYVILKMKKSKEQSIKINKVG